MVLAFVFGLQICLPSLVGADILEYSALSAVDQIVVVTLDESTDRYTGTSYLPDKHIDLLIRFQQLLNCIEAKSIFYDIDFRSATDLHKAKILGNLMISGKSPAAIFEDHLELFALPQGTPFLTVDPYMTLGNSGRTVVTGRPTAYSRVLGSKITGRRPPIVQLVRPLEDGILKIPLQDLLEEPMRMLLLSGKHILIGVDYENIDNKKIAGNRINGVFLHAWFLAATLQPGSSATLVVK